MRGHCLTSVLNLAHWHAVRRNEGILLQGDVVKQQQWHIPRDLFFVCLHVVGITLHSLAETPPTAVALVLRRTSPLKAGVRDWQEEKNLAVRIYPASVRLLRSLYPDFSI